MAASSRRSVRIVRSVSVERRAGGEELVSAFPDGLGRGARATDPRSGEGSSIAVPGPDLIGEARAALRPAALVPRGEARRAALLSDLRAREQRRPNRGRGRVRESPPRIGRRRGHSFRLPEGAGSDPSAMLIDGHVSGERSRDWPAKSRGRRRPRPARRGGVAAISAKRSRGLRLRTPLKRKVVQLATEILGQRGGIVVAIGRLRRQAFLARCPESPTLTPGARTCADLTLPSRRARSHGADGLCRAKGPARRCRIARRRPGVPDRPVADGGHRLLLLRRHPARRSAEADLPAARRPGSAPGPGGNPAASAGRPS